MRRLQLLIGLAAAQGLAACSPAPAPAGSQAAGTARVVGTLLEQVDAPPYSYLRLQTAGGETWVAIPITRLDEKARTRPLTIAGGVAVRNVEAGNSGRRLATVTFGQLEPPAR